MDLGCYILKTYSEDSSVNKIAQLQIDIIGAVEDRVDMEDDCETEGKSMELKYEALAESVLAANEDESVSRQQLEESSRVKSEKGRESVIQLEVPSELCNPDVSSSEVQAPKSPSLTQNESWVVRSDDSDGTVRQPTPNMHSLEETKQESAESTSSTTDGISVSGEMQRYLTSDGQWVYGYRDADSGDFHLFYPSLKSRETHNEKERKRRSRVSDACSVLRKIVPGLNEKTDKATVCEHTTRYLKFLRQKYGNRFDQAFFEKYCLQRS